MNWDQVKGNWKQFSGHFKAEWGRLTDDDLLVAKGNREKLAGRIQKRYGIAREDAEQKIDDWLSRLD